MSLQHYGDPEDRKHGRLPNLLVANVATTVIRGWIKEAHVM
jgi:hypothetical protein